MLYRLLDKSRVSYIPCYLYKTHCLTYEAYSGFILCCKIHLIKICDCWTLLLHGLILKYLVTATGLTEVQITQKKKLKIKIRIKIEM